MNESTLAEKVADDVISIRGTGTWEDFRTIAEAALQLERNRLLNLAAGIMPTTAFETFKYRVEQGASSIWGD